MNYFSKFKSIQYSLDDDNKEFKVIKNPLTKIRFVKDILQNVKLFYDYAIKDSDNAESIAYKIYGDANRYWIVLLANDRLDPYFDFPMDFKTLDRFIIQKYGSVESAKNTIKGYRRKTEILSNIDGITTKNAYYDDIGQFEFDYATNSIVENLLPVDLASPSILIDEYDSAVDGINIRTKIYHELITNYDYETMSNEKMRRIQLLKPEYVTMVERQFKELLTK